MPLSLPMVATLIFAFLGPVSITVSGDWMPFKVSRTGGWGGQPVWLALEWGPLSIQVRR